MADPAPPGSLVALRDRREAAIQQLADGFAADLLTMDQFDDRVARAHSAATVAELDALVADLPAPSPPTKTTALVPLGVDASLEKNATKKRLLSFFGSLERHGAWIVPDRISVGAVFGSTVLDFREARFSSQAVTLEVLAVECDGSSIFGSIESHAHAVADPDRPILRITGTALFGSIEVQTRLPGESAGDARRRKRRERKALQASRRAALPAHG